MMGLRDNITLSFTKLRVRRVRLGVTLVVSGIIFTVLVFSSLFSAGVSQSLRAFTSQGLLSHYLTLIYGDPAGGQGVLSDPAVVARAKVLDQDRVAAETKEAKRLGLPFDPKTAPGAVAGEGNSSGGSSTGGPAGAPVPASSGSPVTVDPGNPAGRQAIIEISHGFTAADALAVAKPYHPTATYESFWFASAGSFGDPMSLTPVINGQEQEQKADNGLTSSDSIAGFQSELNAFSSETMKPFVLPGTSLSAKPGDPIPVLAPVDAVEKLVGVAALSKNATPAQQIARIGELRSKAKNLVFQVCYRNSAAQQLQATATQQAADIAAHKSDSNYQQPDLVYAQPNGACQPTKIASDTRSADEKAQAANQDQFDKEFGNTTDPVTTMLKFKIVGVEPEPPSFSSAFSITGLISSIFTSSLGTGWVIPIEVARKDPALGPIVNDPLQTALDQDTIYVDFANRADQKHFMDAKNCTPGGGFVSEPTCPAGKYVLTPFGNPLATLQDASAGISKGEVIALSIIALLAAIVMMGTIGKIIADSRKETSVFRALGAKRLDIAQIYLLYTVFLATLAFGVAVVVGAAGPIYLQLRYGPAISAQTVLAFNSQNLHQQVHLLGFNPLEFLEIFAFVVAVALVSAVIPLLNGIKRNPVKDMREE